MCIPWEDGWVHRAAVLVDDWEGGPGVLGHGNTVPDRQMGRYIHRYILYRQMNKWVDNRWVDRQID